jgi:hypothetical protein
LSEQALIQREAMFVVPSSHSGAWLEKAMDLSRMRP